MSSVGLVVLGMICGAIAIALAYGAFVLGKKLTLFSRRLVDGLFAIGSMATTNQKLADTAAQVAIELQLLRSAMTTGVVNEYTDTPPGENDDSSYPIGRTAPKKPVYPKPNFDLYRMAEAPDATIEDTEIVEQDDEQLVIQEQLEETRGNGFEAEGETP